MTIDDAIKLYTSNAFYEKSDGNLQGYLEFNQLAEWLKELKELKSRTDWIPVSERLPGYGEKVLCWTSYNAFEVGYRDNEWGQDVWTTGKFASGTFRVVAWMPLPEPYNESEDKE